MNVKNLFLAMLIAAMILVPAGSDPLADGLATPGEYDSSAVFDGGNVTVSWTIGDPTAWFALSVRGEGWVALGFGAETMMQGADMAIGWVDDAGTPFLLDCYSEEPYGPHPPDTELGGGNDLLSFAAAESGGFTTIEFSRPIAASDAFDKPIVPGGSFIWAYGSSDDFEEYHPLAGYGSLDVPGQAGSADAGSGTRSILSLLLFVLPHALPLVLAFILMSSGMLVARYGKKNKKWLAIHKPLGVSGSILGIIGLGFGIRMVALSTGLHLRVPHTWFGVVTLILAVMAPALGQAMFKVKKNKAQIRKIHRWVGRAAIILMGLTILSGLVQSGILRFRV